MKQDPFCFWCRTPLFFSPQDGSTIVPNDYPTIDHLNDKVIKSTRPKNQHFTKVLACRSCNEGRARAKQMSSVWRQRWKSGQFPFPMRWVGKVIRWKRKQPRGLQVATRLMRVQSMKTDPKLAAIRRSNSWTKRITKPKDDLQREIDGFYSKGT